MLQTLGIEKTEFKGWQKNEEVFKQMVREAIRRGRASFQNRVKVSGSGFKTKYPELNKHANSWWEIHKVQNKERVTHYKLEREVKRFAERNKFPSSVQWTINWVVGKIRC